MIHFFRDCAKRKVKKLLVAVIIVAFLCILSLLFLISSGFEESESSLSSSIEVDSRALIERSLTKVSITEDDVQLESGLPRNRNEALRIKQLEYELELQRKVNSARSYPVLLDSVTLELKTDAKSLLDLDDELSTQVSSLLDSLLDDVKRFEFEGAEIQRMNSGTGVRVHIKGSESVRDLMISNAYESLLGIVGLEKSNILRSELERALSNVGESKIYEFQSVMSDSMGESLEIKRFVGGEGAPSFTRTVSFRNTNSYAETISRYGHLIEIADL